MIVHRSLISSAKCEHILEQLPAISKLPLVKESITEINGWHSTDNTPQRFTLNPIKDISNIVLDCITAYSVNKNLKINRMYVTKYFKGDDCKIHSDKSLWTAIILLEDNFTGGRLFLENRPVKLNKGDCVIFDGSKLHSVEEITRGTRSALNVWVQNHEF